MKEARSAEAQRALFVGGIEGTRRTACPFALRYCRAGY